MLILHIANKNYSSWSLRPWVLLKELSIPFQEQLHVFNQEDFTVFSPSGLVPCLEDGDTLVWESLAIVEYIAEDCPQAWPTDRQARAWARAATAEMHGGFFHLRNTCSMSCGQRVELFEQSAGLQKDCRRLEQLWLAGLRTFGGPFLAGNRFGIVDAFFAPIAFRLQTYGLTLSEAARTYARQLLSLDSMQQWYQQALAETWRDEPHEKFITAVGRVINDFRVKSN